jgi:hypothetical protein
LYFALTNQRGQGSTTLVTNGAAAAYAELSRGIEDRVGNWRFPSASGQTVVNVSFVLVTERTAHAAAQLQVDGQRASRRASPRIARCSNPAAFSA